MLKTLPSRQCIHCQEQFHWSETSHETNCQENPKNQCFLCSKKFEGNLSQPAEHKLRKHVAKCTRKVHFNNNYKECDYITVSQSQFCYKKLSHQQRHRDFHKTICKSMTKSYFDLCESDVFRRPPTKSTYSADEYKEPYYLVNCRSNPKHVCQYCGKSIPGWGRRNVLINLKIHESLCCHNFYNRASCRYCSLTFFNSTDGTSTGIQKVENHEIHCKSNPYNACCYCSLKFPGPKLLNQHLYHCSQAPGRRIPFYQHASFYDPAIYYQNLYDEILFDQQQWQQHFDKHHLPQAEDHDSRLYSRQAQDIIHLINQELALYEGDILKKQLKRLLLRWHPDKTHFKDLPQIVVTNVFRYIYTRWKQKK